jgi:cytochrome c
MNKTPLILGACGAALFAFISFACAHPIPDAPIAQGDAIRGKATFGRRCTGCHALNRDDEGPRLGGVYGRTSGTVPRFPYSDALKDAHIVWNDKSLEQWLAGPDIFVPGSGMPVHVAKPEERRDLIAYLKTAAPK